VTATARLGDRSLFPQLEARAYLNHAGVSPPSAPVREAVAGAVEAVARLGGEAVAVAMARRRRLKDELARLVGARPEDLALTQGTSAGIAAVALCVPWRRRDRIVLFEGEFPANVTPWQRAAALFGLEAVLLPLAPFERGDAEGLASLEAELSRGARLVAVSAVQFRTGLAMPLREMAALCARHGAEIAVDAVQALGAVPLDVSALGVDYLAGGAHKWLMGLHGAGLLYVRPERAGALRPAVAGWLSHEQATRFLTDGPGHLRYDRPIRTRADLVEAGSGSEASFAALEASLGLIASLGVPAIHAHVNRCLDRLEPELVARGFASLRAPEPARRSGILSASPPPGVDVVRLRRALAERGVASAIPDGLLRFSPHWPNDPAESAVVAKALDAALAEAR
jgi:cysteine desulfurase / selenocysteine lyase